MRSKQRSGGWERAGYGLAAVLALGFLFSPAARAELQVFMSRDSDPETAKPAPLLEFRPNVTERVYVYVRNTADEVERATVRLAKAGPGGVPLPLAERQVAVAGKKTERVSFAKPPEPDAKPADAKKEPPFVPLDGPPFALLVQIVPGGEKPAEKPKPIQIDVLGPHERVQVTGGFDKEGRTLTLTATASGNFEDQTPARLELVLDHVQDLIPKQKEGTYTRKLLKKNDKVELVARNLEFAGGGPPKAGRVYVDVDGCARAIGFNISFTAGTNVLQPLTEPEVRLPMARLISKPTEKMPLPLEVYNAKERDHVYGLEVFVDRNKDGKESDDEVVRYNGVRRQQLSVSPADPAGGLLFKAVVQDWQVELDTTGLYGAVNVEARITRDKAVLNRAAGELVIDESPPKIIELVHVEKPPLRGELLTVRVRAQDETPIDKVLFFVGDPLEGKTGPEAPRDSEKGVPIKGQTDQWEAQLQLPDRKGKAAVGVQVVNRAGLVTFDRLPILIADPAAAGADPQAGKRYKVSGTVVEGDRLQPDLEVLLKDEKGAVKGSTRTGKDPKTVGTYTFENVAPGSYTVSSSKVGSNTKGEKAVAVEAADVTGVEIQLFR